MENVYVAAAAADADVVAVGVAFVPMLIACNTLFNFYYCRGFLC